MKRFIIVSIKFLLWLFIILMSADLLISHTLQRSKDGRYVVWNDIIEGNIKADALIMGSSRAYVQYSTYILDSIVGQNFYNIGMNGSPINRQVMRYNIYRHFNAPPKLIVQNIDFLSTLKFREDGFEKEQFFPFWYNLQFRKLIQEEPFSVAEQLFPFIRYYGYDNILSMEDELVYKGYRCVDRKWDGSELSKIDSLEFYYESAAEHLFVEYIQECKKDGIEIIFVYAPFYIEAINKVRDLDKMYAVFSSIADEYNIPILDYTFSEIAYDTTYFYNATHLNKLGAELFSKQLAQDINQLGILD